MAGDASLSATPSLAQTISAALVGDATITGAMRNLLLADMVGEASITASASLAAAASAALAGDASVSAPAEVLYAASAAVQGDGTVSATSRVDYGAQAALQGDAALVATPVADDEIAGDLIGGSSFTGAALKDHAAEADLVGETVITVVGIVSPFVSQARKPPSPELPSKARLQKKEFGSARILVEKARRFTEDDPSKFMQGKGKLPTVDKDAASKAARHKVSQEKKKSGPVVPGSE